MKIDVCRDGAEVGSYTGPEFEQAIRLGAVQPTDYYWTDGMSDWRRVSEYKTAAVPAQPVAVTHTVRTRPETSPVTKMVAGLFAIIVLGVIASNVGQRDTKKKPLAQREALAAADDARIDADLEKLAAQGQVKVGMTAAQCRKAWGEPTRIENIQARNPSVRWTYERGGRFEYLILEGEWLVKVQR